MSGNYCITLTQITCINMDELRKWLHSAHCPVDRRTGRDISVEKWNGIYFDWSMKKLFGGEGSEISSSLVSRQSYIFDNRNATQKVSMLRCFERDRRIIAPTGREDTGLIFLSLYLRGRLIESGKPFNGSLRESSFALYLVSDCPTWAGEKRGFVGTWESFRRRERQVASGILSVCNAGFKLVVILSYVQRESHTSRSFSLCRTRQPS